MKLFSRIFGTLVGCGIGLFVAEYFIEGVTITRDYKELAYALILLTLANLFIRPITKLVLSPLIILTLGLFTIVINAGILYAVDFYASGITITGFYALIVTSIIVGVSAAVIKKIFKWIF